MRVQDQVLACFSIFLLPAFSNAWLVGVALILRALSRIDHSLYIVMINSRCRCWVCIRPQKRLEVIHGTRPFVDLGQRDRISGETAIIRRNVRVASPTILPVDGDGGSLVRRDLPLNVGRTVSVICACVEILTVRVRGRVCGGRLEACICLPIGEPHTPDVCAP